MTSLKLMMKHSRPPIVRKQRRALSKNLEWEELIWDSFTIYLRHQRFGNQCLQPQMIGPLNPKGKGTNYLTLHISTQEVAYPEPWTPALHHSGGWKTAIESS
ncbi:hypothetical protein ACOMHN_040120 [Nucella lapillus]